VPAPKNGIDILRAPLLRRKDRSLNFVHKLDVQVLHASQVKSTGAQTPGLIGCTGRQVWGCVQRVVLLFVRNVGSMKLSRHQVIGSVLLALIVLAVLVVRAWPLLFNK
jgi:hypothetical protein